MPLARAWMLGLGRASAGALLGPLGLLAAVAVLALGGGLGSLGALGDLVAGPAAPPATQAGRSGSSVALNPRAAGALAVVALPSPAAVAASPGAPAPARAPLAAPNAGGGGQTTAHASLPADHPSSSASGHGVPTAPAKPSGGSAPSIVDGLAATASTAASVLPAPAAGVVTQTLKAVATTADGVLPPPPKLAAPLPVSPPSLSPQASR